MSGLVVMLFAVMLWCFYVSLYLCMYVCGSVHRETPVRAEQSLQRREHFVDFNHIQMFCIEKYK